MYRYIPLNLDLLLNCTVDSMRTLFETIPEACIIEFLREAGFDYLIWMAKYPMQLFIQISHQLTLSSWINPHSLGTLFETIPETCIAEFLREAGFFYLIWKAIYPVQHIIRITHQLTKFGIYINHHILTPLDSLKPQAQHANKPTSAIDLTISTPGLALRSGWEVLPDTHGSDHYQILNSILPSVAEIQPSCDPSHWVFSKANWEQFHDVCLESISEDILEEADALHSFVEHITKAANDCIPRATTIPKKSNPWFDEECQEALKARRALDERVRQRRELRGETISAFKRSQANVTGKYLAKTSALLSNF